MPIRKLLRYRGWKVWQIHDMHISLLAIFYVLIVDSLLRSLDSIILISSLGFYFMYGFLINDFYDRSHDITAGKKRAVHELSETAFVVTMLSVIFISALHLLYLKNVFYTIVYSISYLLATLYSAPATRFKERGFFGITIDALIEKVLPVLAIFTFFNHFEIDMFIFLTAAFSLQVVEITTHQIHDCKGDQIAGIHTFVVNIGVDKAIRIFRHFIAPVSALFMVLVIFLISLKVQYAEFIVAVVFLVYLVIFLLVSKNILKMEEKVFPLYMSPLYLIINNAFPLFLAFSLTWTSPSNIVLLIVAIGSQYYLFKKFSKMIKEKVIPRTEITDG